MSNENKKVSAMGFIQYCNSNVVLEFNTYNIIGEELILDLI